MVNKLLISLIVSLLVLPALISSQIILNEQPNNLYNSNEVLKIPAKIITSQGIENFLSIKLICNGIENEMYKEYISLSVGQEKIISASIPLLKKYIITTPAKCVYKITVGEENLISNEFTVSSKVQINLTESKYDFNPKEKVILKGTAIKENNQKLTGILELEFNSNQENIKFSDTIIAGNFETNFTLPEKIRSGKYLVMLKAYDKDINNEIGNIGEINYEINIKQVPTNIEIITNTSKINPGENIEITSILHDQVGDPIPTETEISVLNEKENLIEKRNTKEKIILKIPSKTPPSEWTIIGKTNNLEGKGKLKINEYEKARILLINETLIVSNIGNVPYEDIILVKIGNQPLNINVSLKIEEEKQYKLSAPTGEYEIEVISDDKEKVTGKVILTGNAISVKEVKEGAVKVASNPITWLFIITILSISAYLLYKKGYRRVFLGSTTVKRQEKTIIPKKEGSIIKTRNKAVLSLSLKGDKHNAEVVCLRIKNYNEMIQEKQVVEQVMNEISSLAESKNAYIYENGANIFFIFSGLKTKTFKNIKTAIDFSKDMQSKLEKHNKLFRIPINYSIAINSGDIVGKDEKGIFNFMPFGETISSPKKITLNSGKEIALSEKTNSLSREFTKTEKKTSGDISYYALKELKRESEDNKKFISNFVRKYQSN